MTNNVPGEVSPDKMAGDDSKSKKIVHKIRSDVKVRNEIYISPRSQVAKECLIRLVGVRSIVIITMKNYMLYIFRALHQVYFVAL